MLKISVNADKEYYITEKKQVIYINNEAIAVDMIQLSAYRYHLLINHQSYRINLLSENTSSNEICFRINGKNAFVKIQTEKDLILEQLGMNEQANAKKIDLKAPMPGQILKVFVEEGQQVEKGDSLLILEAMKMENILKAENEGVVKKISIKSGQNVDKGQLLIKIE